ncbi:hypothetical protein FRB91_002817 [Serendipita sp. 411]|nr:hypothetical protein FRB91_002817 [Serendipita sp. 411]KAG9058122.1 hypothetical protein FS842_001306 [Serendipita sp. 407]
MKSHTLSVFLTLAIGVFAAPFNVTISDRSTSLGCGSKPSQSEIQVMEASFQDLLHADEESRRMPPITWVHPDPPPHPPVPPKKRTVKVVWHNIYATTPTGNVGYLSDDVINKQMAVLNGDYSGLFTFKLTKLNRVNNNDWHDHVDVGNALEQTMKKQLRVGGAETLNVYSVGLQTSQFLGYSSFPQNYNGNKLNDGILITYDVLPGGKWTQYNIGRTLTHEVGHWTGLYHVFEGGCSDGDGLTDTPPQGTETRGCPTGKDSCPGGGVDSIHNYMDYSDDEPVYWPTEDKDVPAVQSLPRHQPRIIQRSGSATIIYGLL